MPQFVAQRNSTGDHGVRLSVGRGHREPCIFCRERLMEARDQVARQERAIGGGAKQE